jgi:hypothetical protein
MRPTALAAALSLGLLSMSGGAALAGNVEPPAVEPVIVEPVAEPAPAPSQDFLVPLLFLIFAGFALGGD